MILLSNLLKITRYDEKQLTVKQKPIRPPIDNLQIFDGEQHDDQEQANESIEQQLKELEQRKAQKIEEINQLEKDAIDVQANMDKEKQIAKKEIESWWDQKQLEIQEAMEEARKEGYKQGIDEGIQQASQDYASRLFEASQTITQAYAEKERLIHSAETFILSLSIKMASKILQEELDQDSTKLIQIIQEGLKQVEESGEIIIQVAVPYYSKILPHIEELEYYTDSHSNLKVIPDYEHHDAGCLIHTSLGTYNVTIDNQLKEIKKHLLSYFEECVALDAENK